MTNEEVNARFVICYDGSRYPVESQPAPVLRRFYGASQTPTIAKVREALTGRSLTLAQTVAACDMSYSAIMNALVKLKTAGLVEWTPPHSTRSGMKGRAAGTYALTREG